MSLSELVHASNLQLFKLSSAAVAINVSERTFREWIKDPAFPRPRLIRGRRYWLGCELRQWILSHEKEGVGDVS